jgi:hypothetical protein
MNVSDQILQRLRAWGVYRVFGYPGDGINGLTKAFGRIGDRMQFVQARHEELASFMATAHAKSTGEVSVCMATSGLSAIHLLNALYNAKADHVPLVAIVGQASCAAIGGDYPRGRPREPVQGRRSRVRPYRHGAGSGAPPRRPRDAHRRRPAHGHRHHRAERPAGARRGEDAAARARHGAFRHRPHVPTDGPRRRRPACRPHSELWSHYNQAVLPRRFDAWVWFDETEAVTFLGPEHRRGDVLDTYPFRE